MSDVIVIGAGIAICVALMLGGHEWLIGKPLLG